MHWCVLSKHGREVQHRAPYDALTMDDMVTLHLLSKEYGQAPHSFVKADLPDDLDCYELDVAVLSAGAENERKNHEQSALQMRARTHAHRPPRSRRGR